MRLQEKVAIVTGGGTGIGKAIAIAFAKEGATVAICGRRKQPLEETVKEITTQGGTAVFQETDVSSSEEVNKFIQFVYETFGKIDILVNNAGIALGVDIANTSEHDWDNIFCVDVKSMFFTSKGIIPYMLKQHSGKIINIASIAGITGFEKSAAYCSAKGAIVSLTRQMALDYAKNNIQINAIAPGIIVSDMTKEITQNKETKDMFLQNIPAGKFGNPEDIAYTAMYLGSEESNYVTGQTIVVDGGWTIH